MNADENIDMLKQIPPPSKYEIKRARRTALVLATSTIISVLVFIYAFLQKAEANKQATLAQEMRIEVEMQRSLAEKSKQMAERAREEAVMSQMEAERQRLLAEKALADCKSGK